MLPKRCKSLTKDGKRCMLTARNGDFCPSHDIFKRPTCVGVTVSGSRCKTPAVLAGYCVVHFTQQRGMNKIRNRTTVIYYKSKAEEAAAAARCCDER